MKREEVVEIINDEGRAGTFLIADGFQRRHDRIIKHVKNYHEIFLSMENNNGRERPLLKRKRKSGKAGKPIQEYLLNETQTIFLGTLFRTSSKKLDDPVLLFKVKLAKEFIALREINARLQQHKQQPEYLITREAGKIVRRQTTDAMQEFIAYAESQGSENADKYYMAISKMLNSLLFIVEGKFKNIREVLTTQQLMTVSSAEQIIDRGLVVGMRQKKYYKEIFKDVKKKVMLFAELHGQSEVVSKQLKL